MDVYQRRRLVALSAIAGVFVLIVVVIASAGGDDEPEAPITTVGTTEEQVTALPKQDYIDEADGICGEVNSALAGIDTSDAADVAAEELALVAGELEQLQSLPPPDSDETGANDFLRALQNQVEVLQDRQTAIEREDDAALAGIETTLATAEADAQEAAANFGFEVCGNPDAGDTGTDTGGATPPTEAVPVEPAPVEPAPVEPAPPADGGTGDGGDDGTGGVSP
jgi:ABC-type transporter Mla subunit MlaD